MTSRKYIIFYDDIHKFSISKTSQAFERFRNKRINHLKVYGEL